MQTLRKAKLCLKIIDERKAIDPILLDVGRLTSYTDYFIVAGGSSSRQVQAISEHLQARMREHGFRTHGIEGEREGHWVLLDYGDVVVHIFYEPFREFYDLEGLYLEAPRIPIEET